MAAVGALSPERHFSRDQRPAPRRPRLRKDSTNTVAPEVTSGSSSREGQRHASTIRDLEVGVGANQGRPWPASAAARAAAAAAAVAASGGSEDITPGSSHCLEERFRSVNISDNDSTSVPSWGHVGRVSAAHPSGAVPAHPMQRSDTAPARGFPVQAVIPREPAGMAQVYRRGGMSATSIENGWPPLGAPPGKGTPTPIPAVTSAGPPAIIPPTAASVVTTTTVAPVDARDSTVPTAFPRRVPRSLSCDGWIEPACGPLPVLAESSSDDAHHLVPSEGAAKHINSPAASAVVSRSTFSKATSSASRKPLSPTTPRGRQRGEDWNRSQASTPPPPPSASVPVPTPPKQQQRHLHQHQQQVPQSHVHARHRYPPWDGNIPAHPHSPPRQQHQQQRSSHQHHHIRQRHTTVPYETVYWRQAPLPPPPPPGVATHRPLPMILTHAEHQVLLHHQMLQHQREQLHQRDQQLHREQTQAHQQQHTREYPPSRDQPMQRGSLQVRDHHHHQYTHRDQRRGRPRSENGRDAGQGLQGRRPSPTPQDTSRRPLSPPPSSMSRSGPPPASDWQRNAMKGGGMHHRNLPRPVFYQPSNNAATAAAGPGGMASVQVLGHAGYPIPDSAAPAMQVALPSGSVPILSIVTPTALFPPYAFFMQVPVHRRASNSGGGGGGAVNGHMANGNGGGVPNGNGNANGNGHRVMGGVGNDGAASTVSGVGGSVATGAVDVSNGGGGVPVAGGGPVSGGGGGPVTGGGGGSRTARVRVRVHGPNSHKLPPAPACMIVKTVARGTKCDNRVEVMARAPALEMKRRANKRQPSWKIEQPRVISTLENSGLRDQRLREGVLQNGRAGDEDIGVDFGDFGVDRHGREGEGRIKGDDGSGEKLDGWGPRSNTGPILGGWDDCDAVCTVSESCTGTISSVERPEGGWCAQSCTLSSCSEETGVWGDADGTGSSNESRSGSRAESMVSASDGADEVEADWPTDLRNSIGIVTDLVVPCQKEIVIKRCAENGRNTSAMPRGMGASDWDSEGDEEMEGIDEEEREMLAALEAFYERGKQQLQEHAERHARGARQRSTGAWMSGCNPAQQSAYRERTQR